MAGLEGIVEQTGSIKEVIHYSTIEPLYCFAHNDVDVFHYAKIYGINRLSTGQPNLEVYSNTDDLVARGLEFGVTIDLELLA